MIYFVTGGSRGLGKAVVLHAAKEGNDVAFTYVSNADAAKQVEEQAKDLNPNVKVKAYRMDLRDPSSVEAVADQVLEDRKSTR